MNTKFCVCFRVWRRWWRRWRRKWIMISKWRRNWWPKICNHVHLKTMENIFADISDGKWWHCMFYSNNNKIILICTHTFGYVIYKHHTVGIVLKVNPQSHCCYQTQSIKHTHRNISQYQRYFYLFRRKKEMHMHLLLKSENMLRHLLQKMAALPKVLSHSVITMMTFATTS